MLAPEDDATRLELLLRLGDALLLAGEVVRLGDTVPEQAFALAQKTGDTAAGARACVLALEVNNRLDSVDHMP